MRDTFHEISRAPSSQLHFNAWQIGVMLLCLSGLCTLGLGLAIAWEVATSLGERHYQRRRGPLDMTEKGPVYL